MLQKIGISPDVLFSAPPIFLGNALVGGQG